MSRGFPIDPWCWTADRERGAELVADGSLTHVEIGAQCGVDPATIKRWKASPAFRERVHEHLTAWRAKLSHDGLALKENRIAMLMGRAAMIRGVIRARGRSESHANAPGTTYGQKGIQVRKLRTIGRVEEREIEEFAVDVPLLTKEQGYLQHIAIELGEWKQRVWHRGSATLWGCGISVDARRRLA
jgi:hypothetical protein